MAPRDLSPGAVILYREPRSNDPLWPSVYLADDAVPRSFLRTRPYGHCSAVLKLAPVLNVGQLRWARTPEMTLFSPSSVNEEIKMTIPGLKDAYAMANEAILFGYDLRYWKVILSSSLDKAMVILDNDSDEDEQIQRAIQMSLDDASMQLSARSRLSGTPPRSLHAHSPFDKKPSLPVHMPTPRASKDPTPTSSPPRNLRPFDCHPPSSKRPNTLSPDVSDNEAPPPTQKRRASHNNMLHSQPDCFWTSSRAFHRRPSPTYTISDDSDDNVSVKPRVREFDRATEGKTEIRSLQHPAARFKKSTTSGASAKEVFARCGLNAPASVVPNGDIIEEDLNESSHFVQVFVGPEVDPTGNSNIDPDRRRFKFQLMKHHVWNRAYFRDAVSGKNYFTPVGENAWELDHPALNDISPDDFRFVAEFLSDGDFGHRQTEDEDQFAEVSAQCISAWNAAELLHMTDLQERIVDKIRAAQPWWDFWNVMAFACSVYQSDSALDAHTKLKDLFSGYIASLYFVYLEDDYLSKNFMTRLKQLPELERDVLVKRLALLERQIQQQKEIDVA